MELPRLSVFLSTIWSHLAQKSTQIEQLLRFLWGRWAQTMAPKKTYKKENKKPNIFYLFFLVTEIDLKKVWIEKS